MQVSNRRRIVQPFGIRGTLPHLVQDSKRLYGNRALEDIQHFFKSCLSKIEINNVATEGSSGFFVQFMKVPDARLQWKFCISL